MVSFITISGSLFITLSAKSLLHYRGGCLLHYRLNLLHYREVLHYREFITLLVVTSVDYSAVIRFVLVGQQY